MLQCTDLMHWSAQITHEDRSRRSRSQVHATGVPTSLLSRLASATPAQSGRPARQLGSLRTLPVRFAGRDANKVCLSIVLAEGRSKVQPPSWTSCQVGALAGVVSYFTSTVAISSHLPQDVPGGCTTLLLGQRAKSLPVGQHDGRVQSGDQECFPVLLPD